VSQSPQEYTDAAENGDYFKNWDALGTMISRGASFSGHERNRCFLNLGEAPFANVSSAVGLDHIDDARAIVPVDWDHDGDLDLWVTNRTAPRIRFLRNNATGDNRFLEVYLQGTSCNRDAIGARLELQLGGNHPRQLIRTLRAGDGFVSQTSKWIHFGLGKSDVIESLRVKWPGTDKHEEFFDFRANARYQIVQGSGAATMLAPRGGQLSLAASEPQLPAATDRARVLVTTTRRLSADRYRDMTGREQVLVNGSEKPVLINIWASWCQPCVTELGEFASHADELRDAGLRVVALCADGVTGDGVLETAAVKKLVEQTGFPFETGVATRDLVRELTIIQNRVLYFERPLPLPCSFLFAPSGQLVAIYQGPVSVDQLIDDLALVHLSPHELRAESFPFSGRDGIGLFRLGPIGAALAYREGGYLDEAREQLELHLASKLAEIERSSLPRISEQDASNLAQIYRSLGDMAMRQKLFARAREAYESVLRLLPNDTSIRLPLALAYHGEDRPDDATHQLEVIRQAQPNDPETLAMIAKARSAMGDWALAANELRRALGHKPEDKSLRFRLSVALQSSGQIAEAIAEYEKIVAVHPDALDAANNLAWLYATKRDPQFHQPLRALQLARQICEVTQFGEPASLDTFAAALAANGEFVEAARMAEKAIGLARSHGNRALARSLKERLKLYRSQKSYRE